jgi:hypothetical protein
MLTVKLVSMVVTIILVFLFLIDKFLCVRVTEHCSQVAVLHIFEVPSSNLRPETGYPDLGFS